MSLKINYTKQNGLLLADVPNQHARYSHDPNLMMLLLVTLTIDDIETTMTSLTQYLMLRHIMTNISALVACKTDTLQPMACFKYIRFHTADEQKRLLK
jgi:hypothetical protein